MRKYLVLLFALTLFGCSEGGGANADKLHAETAEITVAENAEETHKLSNPPLPCIFFNQSDFEGYTANARIYEFDGELLSGTVPHHLLAGDIIASFFKTAAHNRPDIETVVIVAPMHEPTGIMLSTNLSDWAAPMGILPTEQSFAKMFMTELNAADNDNIMSGDHSAAALIPFVKYYFPDVSVAALLVSGMSDINATTQLTEILAGFAEEKNCLFVFSVDFSHYLDPALTQRRDMETRETVMAGNIDRIRHMNNEHMDSPRCVITFLQLTELLGGGVTELDHSNSLLVSKLPANYPDFDEGLTSYFIFAGVSE